MAAADLIVVNPSNTPLTIQGQTIAAMGGQFTVVFANIVAWSKDPFLRAYLLSGACYIIAVGVTMSGQTAADFMDKVALGSVVYAS